MRRPFCAPALPGQPDRVTASAGVACFPEDGDTLQAITAVADEALYRAKREGRNRVAARSAALAA